MADTRHNTRLSAFIEQCLDPLPDDHLVDTQYNSIVRRVRGSAWWALDRKLRYFELMADLAGFYSDFHQEHAESYLDKNMRVADRMMYVKKYREVLAEQLVTPCCYSADVVWKRRQLARLDEWVPVSRERVEAAIVADEAFLAAHPTKRIRRTVGKGGAAE